MLRVVVPGCARAPDEKLAMARHKRMGFMLTLFRIRLEVQTNKPNPPLFPEAMIGTTTG
jgi:hypothetical protein